MFVDVVIVGGGDFADAALARAIDEGGGKYERLARYGDFGVSGVVAIDDLFEEV